MDFRVGAATNVGNVRDHNEDAFCVNRKASLYIVADGMGGHAAGEVASAQLKDFIEEFLLKEDRPESLVQCLIQGVQAANRSIYQMGVDDPKKRGMGTTATILATEGDRYTIAQVGDSRGYLYRNGELFQITRDHSRVFQLYESGLITKDEMEDHPMSNVITRSIGNHPTVDPDIYEGDLLPGDRFLLCSDGLTGEVKDAEITAILGEVERPHEAVDTLIQRALEEGGKDNVTCLVLDVRSGDDERRKTVPLTLDQLRRMPPPKAVVEEVDLAERRRSGLSAAAPTDPPPEAEAGPGPRGEGEDRPRRRGRGSGALAGVTAAALGLLFVALVLLTSGETGGGLDLATAVPGAEVYLDSQYKGKTPILLERLPAGTYQLLLKAGGGQITRVIEVRDGVVEPLRFEAAEFSP